MSGAEMLIGGQAMQVIGQVTGGLNAREAARFNEANLKEQAKRIDTATSLREREIRREAGRVKAKAAARAVASGVTLEGSPLDVIAESAANAEREVAMNKMQGEMQRQRALTDAEVTKIQGRTALTGALLGAVGTAASATSGYMG
jgi:hypothetical protein